MDMKDFSKYLKYKSFDEAIHHIRRISLERTADNNCFGMKARDFSVDLLRQNLVHVIASDGYSVDFCPPKLSGCCHRQPLPHKGSNGIAPGTVPLT